LVILSWLCSGGKWQLQDFCAQWGHFDRRNVCPAHGARMVCSAFHSIKAVVSQIGALWLGLQACVD